MRFFSTVVSVALAACAAVVSAQASTKSNAITAPVAGDTINAGKSYTIKWTNTIGSTITLTLETGQTGDLQPVTTIISGIPNTGTYTWIVPATIPASDDYTIMIKYDSNPNDFNYSDRFKFVSSATGTLTLTSASSTASTSSASSTSVSSSTVVSTTSSASTTSAASTTSGSSTSGSSTLTTATATKNTTTTSTGTKTSTSSTSTSTAGGAPPSAANSNLSSPLAVIIAVIAAAMFVH